MADTLTLHCTAMVCGRWREELEAEASRQREKLEQMERDKTDSVLALRKKIDSLDVTKANEISRLQEIHRYKICQ